MSNKRIRLNVGGTLFETVQSTLERSQYFYSRLNGDWHIEDQPYFLDRSGVLFEHVLCFLRNPTYPYPAEHVEELNFYGIDHKGAQFMNKNNLQDKMLRMCFDYVKNKARICRDSECTDKAIEGCPYCKQHGRFVKSDHRRLDTNYVFYRDKMYRSLGRIDQSNDFRLEDISTRQQMNVSHTMLNAAIKEQ